MSIILRWIVFDFGGKSYQFIYYSFDGKTRYTSEVPNHHSKCLMGSSKTFQFSHCRYTAESVLSMMCCPKCKYAAVSVYTRVSLYWDRKKIRSCGHDFEEVTHAYDNWKRKRKDVTDLIGQIEALMLVKYSPRWYNIVERNRRHTLDN